MYSRQYSYTISRAKCNASIITFDLKQWWLGLSDWNISSSVHGRDQVVPAWRYWLLTHYRLLIECITYMCVIDACILSMAPQRLLYHSDVSFLNNRTEQCSPSKHPQLYVTLITLRNITVHETSTQWVCLICFE